MADILTRAGWFIAIILLDMVLRRVGFFKQEDFYVLSKIVVKIRLTAAIVRSFVGRELEPSMIILTLTGFGVPLGVFNGIATFEHDLIPDTHQDISQRKWGADDNDRGRSAVLCIFAMSKTAKKASGNLFTIADRQKRRFLLE